MEEEGSGFLTVYLLKKGDQQSLIGYRCDKFSSQQSDFYFLCDASAMIFFSWPQSRCSIYFIRHVKYLNPLSLIMIPKFYTYYRSWKPNVNNFPQGGGTHDLWLSLPGADSGQAEEGGGTLRLSPVLLPHPLDGGR